MAVASVEVTISHVLAATASSTVAWLSMHVGSVMVTMRPVPTVITLYSVVPLWTIVVFVTVTIVRVLVVMESLTVERSLIFAMSVVEIP